MKSKAIAAVISWTFVLQITCMWSVYDYKIQPRLNFTRNRPQSLLQAKTNGGFMKARVDSYTKTDAYDGMPNMCFSHGFYYCVSDNLCHKTKAEAKDCVQTCSRHLTEPYYCSALGCIFNYTSRTCGGVIAASRRFALNMCDVETTDSDGNWYLKDERIGLNCFKRPDPNKVRNISDADVLLYRMSLIDRTSISLWVPVLEDGNYEIVFKFAEPATYTLYRVHNGTLNGITLFSNSQIAKGTPEWTAIVLTYPFSVSDNVKKLTYKGSTTTITNHNIQWVVKRVEHSTNKNQNTAHAIINAILIKRL